METLDRHLEIEWNRAIIMMEPRPGFQALFIYAGTPGAFRAVIKIEQRDTGNFNSSIHVHNYVHPLKRVICYNVVMLF